MPNTMLIVSVRDLAFKCQRFFFRTSPVNKALRNFLKDRRTTFLLELTENTDDIAVDRSFNWSE